MRRYFTLGIDIFLLLVATLIGQLLRDNLEIVSGRLGDIEIYMLITCVVGVVVLTLTGVSHHIWRFSGLADYQRIAVVVPLIVTLSVGVTFAFNRLDGVSRSLPLLQAILAIALMVGARVIFRTHHLRRQARKTAAAPLTKVVDSPLHSVLVIGLSRLTETYLQSLAELESGHVQVVGLLGRTDRHLGRLAASQKILGLPEDVGSVLDMLGVHGIVVDRIVVTTKLSKLSEAARAALLAIDDAGSIEVQFIGELLGFEAPGAIRRASASAIDEPPPAVTFSIPAAQLEAIGRRRYWTIKRAIELVTAGALLLVVSPIMLVVAMLVALEIGVPVTFWQQRPGLGGTPFRLFKFRTMGAAHAADGRLRSDEERVSWVGNFLRRTRLDELPQLINIVRGDMSFVGPRPLLPRDQSPAHRDRLLVRPGLTGWAQVVGGRAITADDKAALDIWYVNNASFLLDLEILVRTVGVVVFGERVKQGKISKAWQDLYRSGVLHGAPRLVAAQASRFAA